MAPRKAATAANKITESNNVPKKKSRQLEPSTRVLRSRGPVAEVKAVPKEKKLTKVNGSTNGETVTKGKRKIAEKSEENEPPKKVPRGKKNKKADNDEQTDSNNTDQEETQSEATSTSTIYSFKANNIKGEEVPLIKYKGHVCIIVNVASKCGHTSSNYKEFVELYNKYGDDKGLRILAFPCNQFGKQEPGDNEKICEFANKKNVKFDMFEKIEVNGKNAHPLWKYLTGQIEGPKGAQIDWNFTKFLVDKNGNVVERFKSAVKPLALEKELAKLW